MIELIALIAGTFMTALIALVVFAKNSRSITNKLFIGLAIGLTGWSVMTYFSLHTSSDAETLFWIRLIMFFVVIQNTSFFLLVNVFPANQFNILKSKKYILAIVYSAITAVVALTPYLFGDFKDGAPVPGIGMALFLPHALIFALGGLIGLIVRYHRAQGVKKAQLQYFLAGTLLMFTLVPIGNFIVPVVFKLNQFVVVSPLYPIIFSGLFAYGIVAKKMFDIRVTVARAVTYLLLLFTLVGLYASGVFGAVELFFGNNQVSTGQSAVYVIAAIFLAFTFDPLKSFFGRLTNRLFFRNVYKTQRVLDKLNSLLVRAVVMDKLVHGALQLLDDAIKPQYSAIAITADTKNKGRVITTEARKTPDTDELLRELAKSRQSLVVLDEVEDRTKLPLYKLMDRLGVAIIIRLETSDELIGYVLYGFKVNGRIYSNQDINLIRLATGELAIAIQNALRFEEIEHFNETLQGEVRDATAKLRTTNHKLHVLDQAKDDFISMASHQLRTPLTSIKGYLSMVLEGDVGNVTATQRKVLEEAYTSSQRMVYLIGDFLNVSRIQTGKFELERTQANLAGILTDEIDQLRAMAQGRNLKIEYTPPSHFPTAYIDQDKFRQVMMNFIDNAIYYSHANAAITIQITKDVNDIVFKVTDQGIGVPADERHKLFTKFYRATNAKRQRPDGTGIGLFMAQKVIVAHGGSVIFESKENQGSTFGFRLPLKQNSK